MSQASCDMKVTKPINPDNRAKSFASSLNPIIFLMIAIAGLKLNPSSSNSFQVKVAISAWGLLLFSFNVLVNGFQATYNLYHATENLLDELRSFIVTISEIVDIECRLEMAHGANYYYRSLFLTLGVPLIFSVHLFMTGRWKKLWSTLQTIQLETRLSTDFYARCRKRCYLGLGLFTLVVLYIFLR